DAATLLLYLSHHTTLLRSVIAMAACTLLDKNISPIEMSDLSAKTGNIMPGNNGTLWQFFFDAADQYGLKATATNSRDEVVKALRSEEHTSEIQSRFDLV